MSEIQELVKKIKETKKMAERSPGNNPDNYAVKQGFIRRAKDDLEELYLKYRKVIQKESIFILVTGSKKQIDLFSETAAEKFDCFRYDAEEFYNRIAKEVHPAIYENKVSSSNLFDILSSIFEKFAQDLGIIGFPALLFNQKYKTTMKNKSDLISVIKRAFNDNMGAELVGYYTIDMLSRKAVNDNFDGPIVPVVMECYDQELVKELSHRLATITPNVFIVSVGSGKIDETIKNKSIACIEKALVDEVKETMVNIKKNLK
jgi:hypothetical protein